MAKSISSIYDSTDNLVPLYPDATGYYQFKGRRPKEKIEDGLDRMRADAMALSRILPITYEQTLNWFRGVATSLERHECEEAMKETLSNCEENLRNHLIDICNHYSLSIVGVTICSQKTSSPSPKVKSDITAMRQVSMTKVEDGGQEAAHVTQEAIEVSDEKEILPQSRVLSQYWQWYYDFWDKFVKDWFEQCPNKPSDEVSQAYKGCVGALNFDELPEPYYGTPEKGVKAVIINLNPGMSQTDERKESLEEEKFYSSKDTYKGKGPHVKRSLITEFADSCNKQYSKFVQKWSCLDPKYRHPKPDLCGVEWWQGTSQLKVGGRVEWLGRIYNKDLDVQTSPSGVKDSIHPLEVFALELCPYHSKSFNLDDEMAFSFDGEKMNVLPFVVEHVLQPALHAVVENPPLPFAVAIGKTFAILLEKIGSEGKFGIAAKLEKEWWDESEDVEDWYWPKTKIKNTGEYRRKYRKYCLFVLRDMNGLLARFLVCAAPGSNHTPGKDFKKIEQKLILPYIRDTPLTDELFKKLKSLPLRWWNYTSKKTRGNGDKVHTTKTKSTEINHSQQEDEGGLSLALTTVAQFMGKEPDKHNYQLLLWQSDRIKLYLRFTKNRPHVTFNFSVADKQTFVDQYGETLQTWGKHQGFKVQFGKEHSAGNGLQFKPIRPIDLDGVKCNELQEWSDMIIAKSKEILK